MYKRLLGALVATAGLIGIVPSVGHAQVAGTGSGSGYSYVVPPLTVIERNQRNQLDANRNLITNQLQDRYQTQIEAEKATLDAARRQREDYRFQTNTQQRALETQLREEALRLNQQDQTNRERDIRARVLEEEGIERSRRAYSGQ